MKIIRSVPKPANPVLTRMDDLISTINQLQEVFLVTGSKGIDLPQIVVVGSQSSGKSSVLEHLVGKSFLPRGTGIVTRCPLVLQMVHAEDASDGDGYVIFQNNQGKVFTEDQEIAQEIESQTQRLAGSNKGICLTPIFLKIYTASYLNLTLVDLPGLTKVPVGDQPEDIEDQTRDLILSYIENPNSIILAVSPANVDMATSDSLKIAREVDPEGSRTLAVVTKIDLMDEGTDAWDMLTGKIIPVKLGIIGVVNRSQKDIMDKKSIHQSLLDEESFFNKKYRSIAPLHGCPYLQKSVQSILINHIKKCLPKLKENINEKLMTQRETLQSLGDMKLDGPTLLLHLITKFSTVYCSTIKGDSINIQTNELHGGAIINSIFKETLAADLKAIGALAGLSKESMITAMLNATGANPTLFVPEMAFELLVKKQMKRLRDPCLKCVNFVHEELNRIVQHCMDDPEVGLARYPTLQSQVCDVMTELLWSRMPITNEMVDNFIDIQLSYVNSDHPEFLPNSMKGLTFSLVGGVKKKLGELTNKKTDAAAVSARTSSVPEVCATLSELSLNDLSTCMQDVDMDKMSKDCILIQELIKSYFCITRNTVLDTIPKIIMHFMVLFVMTNVQSELVMKLFRSDVSDLLLESRDITERRRRLKEDIAVLETANNIINKFKPSVGLAHKVQIQLPNKS